MRSSARARPLEARVLALFHLVAALCCAVSAAVPMSPHAPRRLAVGVGVLAVLLAAAVWWDPTHRSRHLAVANALVVVTVLVASSRTPAGAILNAFVYLWVVLYAAFFLSRPVARACCAATAAGLAAGFALNPPPGGATEWFVVVVSCAVAGEAVSRVVAALRGLAVTDPLTGVPNRAGLVQLGALACARADRRGDPLSVVVVDLDGFKQVNDVHGHAAGDALLVGLASAWRSALRAGDVLARTGGDEFVLLLPDTPRSSAEEMLARLRAAFPAGWSAGVVQRAAGEDLETCQARADEAMYEHKSARRAARAATRAPAAVGG